VAPHVQRCADYMHGSINMPHMACVQQRRSSLKQLGYPRSYLACGIGHWVPIWATVHHFLLGTVALFGFFWTLHTLPLTVADLQTRLSLMPQNCRGDISALWHLGGSKFLGPSPLLPTGYLNQKRDNVHGQRKGGSHIVSARDCASKSVLCVIACWHSNCADGL
jgi:hypothetical protein